MAQKTDNEALNGTNSFLKQFEKLEERENQPAWLFPLRKAGISSFAEQGFPTLKDEDWRFTNLAPLTTLPFQPAQNPASSKAGKDLLAGAVFAKLEGSRLVFVNGHFAADLSLIKPLPAGVRVSNLAAALAKDSAFVEKHL